MSARPDRSPGNPERSFSSTVMTHSRTRPPLPGYSPVDLPPRSQFRIILIFLRLTYPRFQYQRKEGEGWIRKKEKGEVIHRLTVSLYTTYLQLNSRMVPSLRLSVVQEPCRPPCGDHHRTSSDLRRSQVPGFPVLRGLRSCSRSEGPLPTRRLRVSSRRPRLPCPTSTHVPTFS